MSSLMPADLQLARVLRAHVPEYAYLKNASGTLMSKRTEY
jgi:hypothetical protein